MRLFRLWKLGILVALTGVVVMGAAACAGGQTATPAPKVTQTLIVDANTVIGSEGVKNPQDICVVSSRFQQGQTVVWQIKVYDPTTGKIMDDKALDSVVVSLKDGQTFTAQYGPHPGAPPGQPQPPATDYFWTSAWSIPTTYPTGSAPFTVTAKSKDGRTGTFSEFNVAPALLTVVVAQEQPLILDANTVISAEGAKSPQDICVVSSRFQQGQGVVWRIKVYDPATGNPMDDKTLDSVVVTLQDGQTFNSEYGPHPGQPGTTPTDYFWTADWAIPQNYPTGSVPYQVTAKSKDGRTGTFSEFNVGPSLLTVVAAQ